MEGLRNLLLVGAGGALGSGMRYLVSLLEIRGVETGFPWRTLLVNIAGSIALALVLRNGPMSVPDGARLFLGVGVLGGFTTYSSFNYEVVDLIRQGHSGQAAFYVGLTFMVAFGAAMILVDSPA